MGVRQLRARLTLYNKHFKFEEPYDLFTPISSRIGTQGPAPIYDQLKLQMITCTGGICRIGKEGAKLIMLDANYQTSSSGIYAIGGAVSPSYIAVEEKGSFQEVKHPNLIFTAVRDAEIAMADIVERVRSAHA